MYVETSIYFQFDTTQSLPMLDTEVQVSHYENGYTPVGSYVGSGSDSVHGTYSAWRQIIAVTQPGQTFNQTIDLYQLFQNGLTGLSLLSGTTGHLVRIEPGMEGYGVTADVEYYTASLSGAWPTSPPSTCTNGATNPPTCNICPTGQSLVNGVCTTVAPITSGSFTLSATSPSTGQTVTFQGSVVGGLAPYSYSWNFGDGSTGSTSPTSHTFATAGTYDVVLIVGDSAGHTLTVSQTVIVIVQPSISPLSLSVPGAVTATPGARIAFVVNWTNTNPGRTVAMTAAGLPPGASFDPSARQFSWSPTASDLGSYNVTFTGTDNGSPPKSSSKSVMITVQQASQPPASQPTQGPRVCLQCLLTPTAVTSLWLVTIAGLVGMIGMIGAFYLKTRAHLAAAKRVKRLNRKT
jgi:PKD repeat protein